MTLHRITLPESLTVASLEALVSSLEAAVADTDARAWALVGSDKTFCRGMDLAAMVGEGADAGSSLSRFATCVAHLRRAPRPTIAVVLGDALGGGVGLAAACDVVLCAIPARYLTPTSPKKPKPLVDAVFFGASSNQFGSPQAEFEIPYGNLGQNGPYGQVAQRYASVYGYDERAMAKIVVDQRFNANHTEGAVWKDKPLTIDDVLAF